MSLKILIVEDNADNRELMVIVLEFHGFTIVTAVNGREGLNVAGAEHPDLIITDINMPDLDGIEMIRLLREHVQLRTTPILVLTAYGDAEAENAIKAGADQAMTKPVQFASLMTSIQDLLADRPPS